MLDDPGGDMRELSLFEEGGTGTARHWGARGCFSKLGRKIEVCPDPKQPEDLRRKRL